MYAIFEDGGKQVKVEKGTTVSIELRAMPEGQEALALDRVLFYRDETQTLIGQPYVAGAKVLATVAGESQGPKLHPMQFRRRKNSRRRIGHRQKYLDVVITDIVRD